MWSSHHEPENMKMNQALFNAYQKMNTFYKVDFCFCKATFFNSQILQNSDFYPKSVTILDIFITTQWEKIFIFCDILKLQKPISLFWCMPLMLNNVAECRAKYLNCRIFEFEKILPQIGFEPETSQLPLGSGFGSQFFRPFTVWKLVNLLLSVWKTAVQF